MNHLKRCMEITGMILYPIIIGMPVYIFEEKEIRRTSTVLKVQERTPGSIRFETLNTQYVLHLVRPVTKPGMKGEC